MADLTNEQKTYVVIGLAQYMTPQEVVEAVKEEWPGTDITRQQVRHYNPDQSKEVKAEWKELFKKERKKFLDLKADIPMANKAVRLRELETLYRQAKRMGAISLAADIAEKIAKESGDVHTNRREITGKNGGPIQSTTKIQITPEDVDYRKAAAPLQPKDD